MYVEGKDRWFSLLSLCIFFQEFHHIFHFAGKTSAELEALNKSLKDLLDGIQVCTTLPFISELTFCASDICEMKRSESSIVVRDTIRFVFVKSFGSEKRNLFKKQMVQK